MYFVSIWLYLVLHTVGKQSLVLRVFQNFVNSKFINYEHINDNSCHNRSGLVKPSRRKHPPAVYYQVVVHKLTTDTKIKNMAQIWSVVSQCHSGVIIYSPQQHGRYCTLDAEWKYVTKKITKKNIPHMLISWNPLEHVKSIFHFN